MTPLSRCPYRQEVASQAASEKETTRRCGNGAGPGRVGSWFSAKNRWHMANGRIGRRAADQLLIDGIQTHMSELTSMIVGSQTLAPADIVALLQKRLDTAKAADEANAARTAAVKLERDTRAESKALMASLRRLVVAMYTHSPATLAAFGLSAPKVGKPDARTKADAVAKAAATRKARHTMGKKQKQAIKGSLPGDESAPVAPTTAATPKP
jgi:hypothetical protein